MTIQTMTMRRREHSSLHLNGSQTEIRRSDVSKISVHDDTCNEQENQKTMDQKYLVPLMNNEIAKECNIRGYKEKRGLLIETTDTADTARYFSHHLRMCRQVCSFIGCLIARAYSMAQIIQVGQLSRRDRAAGWVSYGQKWKTGAGTQYFYWHYRSVFNHCDLIASKTIEFSEKTQNKGYYAVQSHSRSSRLVSIESPYATSY